MQLAWRLASWSSLFCLKTLPRGGMDTLASLNRAWRSFCRDCRGRDEWLEGTEVGEFDMYEGE